MLLHLLLIHLEATYEKQGCSSSKQIASSKAGSKDIEKDEAAAAAAAPASKSAAAQPESNSGKGKADQATRIFSWRNAAGD